MSILILLNFFNFSEDFNNFKNVVIDSAFKEIFSKNKLLMETTGANIIFLKNGQKILFSVASVASGKTPKEKIEAETVAKNKALAFLTAQKDGVQVIRVQTLNEKTLVVNVNGKEKAKKVEELLEITETKVKGIVKGLPPIGRWYSKDGEILFIAYGACINKKGEIIDFKPN